MIALILCAVSALVGSRELAKGEADALHTVWGVRGMQALSDLEGNPKKFWQETETKLFESKSRALNHFEFCQWFTPKIKKLLAQKLTEVETQPWFAGDIIEELLKKYIPEDSPTFSCALATYYAIAYDYTLIYLTHEADNLERSDIKARVALYTSKRLFEECTKKEQERGFCNIIPLCHKALLWQIVPGGFFSFFESLVARSKGYHLCSVSSNPDDWVLFCAHNGTFRLCSGMQDHDAFTHAINTCVLASHLKLLGISDQDHFKACCNPDALTAGNLITMTHQVQAWFTQFHEIPSQNNSYDTHNFASLLFPGSHYLSDPGFLEVTPYFAKLPADYDWRKKPLQKEHLDHRSTQGTLLAWRALYCFQGFRFLPKGRESQYIKILTEDLRYLTEADLMRAPQFIRTVLRDLCRLEGPPNLKNTQMALARKRDLSKKLS